MSAIPAPVRTAVRVLLFAAVVCGAFALMRATGAAQPLEEDPSSSGGVSRQMRFAIDLYEAGRDLEAMDRFMEILVKGDPVERPMANEYLNIITQRMSVGSELKPGRPASPASGTGGSVIEKVSSPPSPRRIVDEEARPLPSAPSRMAPPPVPEPALPERNSGTRAPREGAVSSADRTVMKREIEGKIQNRARAALERLRRYEDIRVQMATSRVPRAVAIPPDLLFETGIQFKKDAGKILDILADLVFSLGATQAVILPEGATVGNAKILDMRRTMGISAHFFRAGIAPPRVRVNLLSNQVELPRELQDYKGILIVFLYNQPLQLTTDSALDEQGGPPVSLGAWPPSFDPKGDDGAIVEFSVLEPPAGLMSWRFQLLGPGEKKGDDMVVLQEVKGAAPVFHQIYWNGRKNYFGDPYPPGQYEAVLTATDLRNRARKRHLWIALEGVEKPAEPAPVKGEEGAALLAKAPPSELPIVGDESDPRAMAAQAASRMQGKTIGARAPAKTSRKAPSRAKRPAARKAPKAPVAAAEAAEEGEPSANASEAKPAAEAAKPAAASAKAAPEPAPSRAGVVNFQVIFLKGTTTMAQDSDPVLGRVADTMELYPLDKINLVGYAFSGEADAASLAKARVDFVKKRLIEQYKMKPESIQSQTQVVAAESYKVEIYIVRGG